VILALSGVSLVTVGTSRMVSDVSAAGERRFSSRGTPKAKRGNRLRSRQLARMLPTEFRTIDGTGNNETDPAWGRAGQPLLRLTPASYGDSVAAPAGAARASARAISNAMSAQSEQMPNVSGRTDMLWVWGQFVDHDIDLTPPGSPAEPFNIEIPTGDPVFDPAATGGQTTAFTRSAYVVVDGVRQQINAITAFLDASNVYGSDEGRALALRTLDGTGRLRLTPKGLLPFNEVQLPNAPDTSANFFLAGDIRANEQTGLTAMHTVFVREHNVWTRFFRRLYPKRSGDQIYALSRMMVGAEMQAITYNEFLPQFLGHGALPPYSGYRPDVHPGVANAFSTAAYRVGHTMLPMTLLRLTKNGKTYRDGHLSLLEAFFNPSTLEGVRAMDSLLRGLSWQMAQQIDPFLMDSVRNMLFGPPGSGLDLAALNLQRGRDHGLADYNQARAAYGLSPLTSFADGRFLPGIQQDLEDMYSSVNDVDLWMGGLAEQPVAGSMVGETFQAIITDQFERLRDGDRFFYVNHLPPQLVDLAEAQTLSVIIRRNTEIGTELQDNVFLFPDVAARPDRRARRRHR
jgi:hypothetical protein